MGLRMSIRLRGALALFVTMLIGMPLPADGQETSIIGIHQGTAMSSVADRLGSGGYELAHGTQIYFRKWYVSNWVDLRFDMLTQLSDDIGILWGASTGQRATKVKVDPSLRLGIILQRHPTPSTTLAFTAVSILGGNLNELPCTADYGAIGGVQTVNCRLAASILPPAETLKYLVHDHPSRLTLSLWFKGRF